MLSYRKNIIIWILILTLFSTGCSNKHKVSNKRRTTVDKNNVEYKIGTSDGCKTAKGTYTKDHAKFRVDLDYHEGWFNGREKCQIAIW
ncbi:hypothetical protein MNB_SV-9-1161 [hydrothermal vent metagenome]|uniref:Lipoprotein n=1 Tax=hydrothermal vent metagenome TaxID=652676 RepID=A0A1W1BZ90_9ZZZZ